MSLWLLEIRCIIVKLGSEGRYKQVIILSGQPHLSGVPRSLKRDGDQEKYRVSNRKCLHYIDALHCTNYGRYL